MEFCFVEQKGLLDWSKGGVLLRCFGPKSLQGGWWVSSLACHAGGYSLIGSIPQG